MIEINFYGKMWMNATLFGIWTKSAWQDFIVQGKKLILAVLLGHLNVTHQRVNTVVKLLGILNRHFFLCFCYLLFPMNMSYLPKICALVYQFSPPAHLSENYRQAAGMKPVMFDNRTTVWDFSVVNINSLAGMAMYTDNA